MSVVKVDTIRDNGSGFNDVVAFQNSGGTENGRLNRAFVNFNGQGSVAIRGNFNVNSITDNGTGNFSVNFANAMSDANYAIQYSGGYHPGVDLRVFHNINSDNPLTASVARIFSQRNDAVAIDSDFYGCAVFR